MSNATAVRKPQRSRGNKSHAQRGRRPRRVVESVYRRLAPLVQERGTSYAVDEYANAVAGAKPFLKWAGGKRQLLASLDRLLPATFNNYIEPFAGGAAFFFHLRRTGRIASGALSDMNAELVTSYRAVKDDVDAVLRLLKTHDKKHGELGEAHYYKVRAAVPTNDLERAARFIYLNRTCYNGLWRVNSKGGFNVPMGSYKSPLIHNALGLRAASLALSKTSIEHQDFEKLATKAKAGDFVYFDPPYVPLTQTASFTAYTKEPFGLKEQQRLAELFQELGRRGCKVMLSNSGTDVVRSLYEPIAKRIVCIPARRVISSRASTRGSVTEYVVLNYEPDTQLLPLD